MSYYSNVIRAQFLDIHAEKKIIRCRELTVQQELLLLSGNYYHHHNIQRHRNGYWYTQKKFSEWAGFNIPPDTV